MNVWKVGQIYFQCFAILLNCFSGDSSIMNIEFPVLNPIFPLILYYGIFCYKNSIFIKPFFLNIKKNVQSSWNKRIFPFCENFSLFEIQRVYVWRIKKMAQNSSKISIKAVGNTRIVSCRLNYSSIFFLFIYAHFFPLISSRSKKLITVTTTNKT